MQSSKGKRDQRRVKEIIDNADKYAEKIRNMLLTYRYRPSPYIKKTIKDGASKKERIIFKPNYYPDQIIHWALILKIQPIIMRGMYKYCCGSIPNRGTSYGQNALRKWLNNDYKGTKYCLKLDVHKFYPSVDNELLKEMFRKKIKDNRCLWLIDEIIDSAEGLPIGNYTSQWFSNFFLEGMDHFIKEKLQVKYYIRYVDDFVILGGNKRELHRKMNKIKEYLNDINLEVKGDWQVFKVNARPIDFLGLKFYRDKTILRKRTALRITRRLRKIAKKTALNYQDACAVVSYWGWIKRSDSYNFYHKNVKPIVTVSEAKKVVREYAKARNIRRNSSVRPTDTGDLST